MGGHGGKLYWSYASLDGVSSRARSAARARACRITVDETVDDGIILEVDSKTIVNRVLMQGADGSVKDITGMTISQAMEVAREQLLKNVV